MKEVVQTVISETEALVAEKHLTLGTAIADDLLPGEGDERWITQVLLTRSNSPRPGPRSPSPPDGRVRGRGRRYWPRHIRSRISNWCSRNSASSTAPARAPAGCNPEVDPAPPVRILQPQDVPTMQLDDPSRYCKTETGSHPWFACWSCRAGGIPRTPVADPQTAMPGPVSVTATSNAPSVVVTATVIPPASLNLIALPTRFSSTWVIRRSSPSPGGKSYAMAVPSGNFFSSTRLRFP